MGFPGPRPAGGFKAFFRRHELPCSHYYCAYPEATVNTVRQALALEPKLEEFVAGAEKMGPQAFEAAWRSFLGEALLMVLTPVRPRQEEALRSYLEGTWIAGRA